MVKSERPIKLVELEPDAWPRSLANPRRRKYAIAFDDDAGSRRTLNGGNMQIPFLGRIVLVCQNGAEAPAIVTAIHSDRCINVHVFPDVHAPGFVQTQLASVEYDADVSGKYSVSWRWPPRVQSLR